MVKCDSYFYEPEKGHGLRHDPFNAIVAPRPIGWVSSVSSTGVANLAPYSFFNAFNYTPPIIGFSSIGWKDSINNVARSREFCWNLATRSLAEAMNISCAPAPPEIGEFALAGLTEAPSRLIAAPRVLESPVNFECRMTQILQLEGADGQKADTWLALGEVVAVHIDRNLIADGVYDTVAGGPILRGGGWGDYFTVAQDKKFQMRRPPWPLS